MKASVMLSWGWEMLMDVVALKWRNNNWKLTELYARCSGGLQGSVTAKSFRRLASGRRGKIAQVKQSSNNAYLLEGISALGVISPGTYKAHLTLYDNTGFLTARAWQKASVPALVRALTYSAGLGTLSMNLADTPAGWSDRQLLYGAWEGKGEEKHELELHLKLRKEQQPGYSDFRN